MGNPVRVITAIHEKNLCQKIRRLVHRSPPVRIPVVRPCPVGVIPVARLRIIGGLVHMGAKYIPSAKDRKADRRFQLKQSQLPKLKKATGNPPAKKRKKK